MSVSAAAAVEQRVLVHAPRGRDAQVVSQVLSAQAMQPEVCGSLALLTQALQGGAGIAFVTEESLAGPDLEPLVDFEGVMSGMPRYAGATKMMVDRSE